MKHLSKPGFENWTRIALGCDHFGETIPEDTAHELIDLYVSSGGTVLDTACCYGQTEPGRPSTSEVVVGKHLKELDRSAFVVVTKGGHPPRTDFHHSRITEKDIRYDITQSRDQLDTVPDWWLFHRDNPEVPADELVDLANSFIDEGLTQNIGVSNWSAERISLANSWAEKHGKRGFGVSQLQFSLAKCTLDSWGDDTIQIIGDNAELSWYTENQMPYMCFSSQGRGILQKIIADRPLGKAYRFNIPENRDLASAVQALSERTGMTVSAICMAYVLLQKSQSVAIAGAASSAQLAQTLAACSMDIADPAAEEILALRRV